MATKAPKHTFAFEEEGHKYFIDGEEVPSVSAVMKAGGLIADYALINKAVLAHAADRGLYVEGCCRLDDEDVLDEDAMRAKHPDAHLYLPAWRNFRRAKLERAEIAHQVRVYHPQLRYGGTIDVLTNGAVIDIKCTSKLHPHYRVQLQAYNMPGLYLENGDLYVPRPRRIVVQLRNNGTARCEEYDMSDDAIDILAFQSALGLWRWQQAVALNGFKTLRR